MDSENNTTSKNVEPEYRFVKAQVCIHPTGILSSIRQLINMVTKVRNRCGSRSDYGCGTGGVVDDGHRLQIPDPRRVAYELFCHRVSASCNPYIKTPHDIMPIYDTQASYFYTTNSQIPFSNKNTTH